MTETSPKTAVARVVVDTPGRYLVRFCKHASQMGGPMRHRPRAHAGGGPPEMRDVTWDDTDGSLTLDWGRCTLHAGPGVLELRAEADDEDGLARIQELVAGRLEKLGHRAGLTVTWQRQPE
jgi:hypothetical protein